MKLIDPLFENGKTTVLAFGLGIVAGGLWFLITLGIDISYPGEYYSGILPLHWYFGIRHHPTVWNELASGAMISLCFIARLLIAAVFALVMGYVLFWVFYFFGPRTPAMQPGLAKPLGTASA